jgi:adenylosuccinate synthase
VPGRRREKSK